MQLDRAAMDMHPKITKMWEEYKNPDASLTDVQWDGWHGGKSIGFKLTDILDKSCTKVKSLELTVEDLTRKGVQTVSNIYPGLVV